MADVRDIILSAYYPGLGDNLQFSTLPELYSNKGHDVYIESSAQFRNEEIYDFVWSTNPFIKGRKAGEREAGDIAERKLKRRTGSLIRDWEIAHGFEGTNDYPKIYHTPTHISGLQDCMLIDVTSISHYYTESMLKEQIRILK